MILLLACAQAPTVTFRSPAAGSEVQAGEPLMLEAAVSDDDPLEELRYTFVAEPGGELDGTLSLLADGVSLSFTRSLSTGNVAITLHATDPAGNTGTGALDLVVTENHAPTISVVTPVDQSRVPADVAVMVTILVADVDEADPTVLSLTWSGVDGPPANPDGNGSASAVAWFTEPGTGSVSVRVADPSGEVASAELSLDVYDADGDGDGYPSSVVGGSDCDDFDATINPGSFEHCDGVDEDCDGVVDDSPVDGDAWYPDADADGYGDENAVVAACSMPDGYLEDGEDCDDTSAAIHPGATETCDDVDQDCDGIVDDNVPGSPTWYPDEDSDTYGDDAEAMLLCDNPGGYVSTGGDCDDGDSAIHAGATEICDTRNADEDCDAVADDADSSVSSAGKSTWYRDADSDGYGLSSSTRLACDRPSGYTSNATDCDDGDSASHPGAIEICEDGADNDCDGVEVSCELAGTVSLSAADFRLTGVSANDFAGACDFAGDVDGDGYDDIVVGAWGRTGGATSSGAAYVVYGPITASVSLSSAGGIRNGVAASDGAGWAVAGAGDIDSDGFDDVLVGAYGADGGGSGSGVAYLLSGPVSGTASLSTADATIVGEAAGDTAGYVLSRAGDVDGDGDPEILVGAYGEDSGSSLAGAAYLLEGPLSGTVDLSAADATLVGEGLSDRAGYGLGPAGDLDGDGMDDIVIGAPLWSGGGADQLGAAYVLLGPISGTVDLSAADARLEGLADDDYTGMAVWTAGDTDGDGRDDLLVGVPQDDRLGSETGVAYVFLGSVSGNVSVATADATLVGETTQDRAGWSVQGGGDVDGDGFDDVVVGAYYESSVGTGAGAAYLMYGPFSGAMSFGTPDAKFTGESARDAAGKSVAVGGDLDGDGFDDLLVGAPSSAASATGAGALYGVLGGGG